MALPSWLYISQLSGTSGTTTITVSASTNNSDYMLYCFPYVNTEKQRKKIFISENPSLSGSTGNNS